MNNAMISENGEDEQALLFLLEGGAFVTPIFII